MYPVVSMSNSRLLYQEALYQEGIEYLGEEKESTPMAMMAIYTLYCYLSGFRIPVCIHIAFPRRKSTHTIYYYSPPRGYMQLHLIAVFDIVN